MPATRNRRRRKSCGHKNFGTNPPCHRCDQAEKLEAKAQTMKDGEQKTKLLAEARRLKSLDGKA